MRKNKEHIKENIKNTQSVEIFNYKELYKYFFKTPKKSYNPYIYEMFKHRYMLFEDEILTSLKGNWKKEFENENDISIEIGSGSGNFIIELAKRNPDMNYVAFEIRFKRLIFSNIKTENENIENIRYVRRLRLDLLNIFSENEITNFYMNFPEPWDEKLSKRLFSKELLEQLEKIMKDGGKIFFKTDHLDYYEHVIKLTETNKCFKITYATDDLYSSNKFEENIKTEFEHLFIHKLNQTIKYVEIIKISPDGGMVDASDSKSDEKS